MTQIWTITLRGHTAKVSITPDGKGGFSGCIESAEFGHAPIENGVVDGRYYTGTVTLEGHSAKITAHIGDGNVLTGSARVGWFFSADFTGTPI